MSGDWIKMRVDLTDDPAVVLIGALTKLDEFAVVGRLHKLWSWADRHFVDGTGLTVARAWIDKHVACKGFADAMVRANWLDGEDGELLLPHFDRHNGESAKKRAMTNKRVAGHREVKRSGNAKGNASSVTKSEPGSLPEKRREEEEKKKQGGGVVTAGENRAHATTPEIDPGKTPGNDGPLPIADDWQPLGWVQSRIDRAGVAFTPKPVDVAKFVAHYRATPGRVGSAKQWSETFVGWCLREADYEQRDARANGHGGVLQLDQATEIAKAMAMGDGR